MSEVRIRVPDGDKPHQVIARLKEEKGLVNGQNYTVKTYVSKGRYFVLTFTKGEDAIIAKLTYG